ncbi:uncharacterized protein KD926_001532 [Aspergillus affinis]|uniref:uncharacterized protein n=1 Tax=Aspergillus affinis TaxID=1070780 RepID=UPI0022FE96D4|nr:uncharacterized protein KD926_001532 [Aspergillus affinis]KAI9044301.1 hypothetical protein KD926_001532 [Aspergillus affinis]
MAWTTFITAPAVSVKQVHKALLSLEDYEYGCDHSWTLLHNPSHLDDEDYDLSEPNTPPLDLDGAETLDASNNAFAGKTSDEIYAFIRANEEKLSDNVLTTDNWLIIDERGFRTETCLVCSFNDLDDEDGEEEEDDERNRSPFLMARLPWVESWGMFTNLDLANMGFDEWVDEEKGKDADGEYTWVGPFSEQVNQEAVKKREAALEDARKEGLVE